jgi:hypothetical protein
MMDSAESGVWKKIESVKWQNKFGFLLAFTWVFFRTAETLKQSDFLCIFTTTKIMHISLS